MPNTNKMTGADWLPLIVISIFFLVGIWMGYEIGKYQTRCNAIRAGAGEFYLSGPLDQSPDFRWKTNNVILAK